MFPAFTSIQMFRCSGVSRIYFEFTIYCANSLWIRFVFHESTLNLLFISWIYYLLRELTTATCFRELTVNLLYVSQTYYHHLLREFTMNSSFSWISQELSWCFTNSLWIHYFFRESLMNSLLFSRISYEFTWYFANIQWTYYGFTVFINYHWHITMNSISFSRTYYEFANFSEFTTNSLFLSRIHQDFTWYFANIQWIYYEFTVIIGNWIRILGGFANILRFHCGISIFFANLL